MLKRSKVTFKAFKRYPGETVSALWWLLVELLGYGIVGVALLILGIVVVVCLTQR